MSKDRSGIHGKCAHVLSGFERTGSFEAKGFGSVKLVFDFLVSARSSRPDAGHSTIDLALSAGAA